MQCFNLHESYIIILSALGLLKLVLCCSSVDWH